MHCVYHDIQLMQSVTYKIIKIAFSNTSIFKKKSMIIIFVISLTFYRISHEFITIDVIHAVILLNLLFVCIVVLKFVFYYF